MIDITELKPGVKVELLDGKTLLVRGSYMSPTGLVLTAKEEGSARASDRNVPIEDIVKILGK